MGVFYKLFNGGKDKTDAQSVGTPNNQKTNEENRSENIEKEGKSIFSDDELSKLNKLLRDAYDPDLISKYTERFTKCPSYPDGISPLNLNDPTVIINLCKLSAKEATKYILSLYDTSEYTYFARKCGAEVSTYVFCRILEEESKSRSVPTPVEGEDFSMPVEDMFSIDKDRVILTGKIATGIVRSGDNVDIVLRDKTRITGNVAGAEMFRKVFKEAHKGDNVGLMLLAPKDKIVDPEIVVAKGFDIPGSSSKNADIDNEELIRLLRRLESFIEEVTGLKADTALELAKDKGVY